MTPYIENPIPKVILAAVLITALGFIGWKEPALALILAFITAAAWNME